MRNGIFLRGVVSQGTALFLFRVVLLRYHNANNGFIFVSNIRERKDLGSTVSATVSFLEAFVDIRVSVFADALF